MSITNVEILDCNRLNSEEAKTANNENPALWHNKLGSGVIVNPNDKIQVSATFISERGAGDDVIEFKGDSLNISKDIKYTEILEYNASRLITQGYEYTHRENKTASNEVFDNKSKLAINFYTSANGENVFQLPRKFMGLNSVVNGVTNTNKEVWNAQETSIHLGGDNPNYGISGGLPFHQVAYFGTISASGGDITSRPTLFYYVEDDYKINPAVIADIETDEQGTFNEGQINYFKLRTDGSRYMIYGMNESYYTTDPNASFIAPASYWKNEPSDYGYQRIYNNVDIELPKGFDSPSSIASNITNQLRKTGELKNLKYENVLELEDWTPPPNFSNYLESETFKVFNSANIRDMLDINYIDFNPKHDVINETENFAIAGGTNASLLNGWNRNLFINGITGNDPPIQIGGGAGIQVSGGGQQSYDGFASLLEPFPTQRYFAFTGVNTRFLKTKDISNIISNGGVITISWIKGNSSNGGERADLNESLNLRIIASNNSTIVSTISIATGGGTDYPNNIFSTFTHTLTPTEISTGAFIQILQTSSSGGNFDVYGVKYLNIETPIQAPSELTIEWINAHEFISVKRPDLWDAGHEFNEAVAIEGDNIVLDTELIMNGTYEYIDTNILWTDGNFELLNKLFTAQGNYPELFNCFNNDYGNSKRQFPLTAPLTNVDTNRFLHINPYVNVVHKYICVTEYYNLANAWVIKDETWGDEDIVGYYVSGTNITDRPYVTAYDRSTKILTFSSNQNFTAGLGLYLHPSDGETILGTDDISGSGSFRNVQAFNRISLPLMFNFDNSASLTKKSGIDSTELNYGYAKRKVNTYGTDYISFWIGTEATGVHPPDQYFENNNGGNGSGLTIYPSTCLGWDRHYTAYSTCVMGLIDGWTDTSYLNSLWNQGLNSVWDSAVGKSLSPAIISFYMKKTYIGSNEPLIEYDTDQRKFNIQQLHTPEYIGNTAQAGGTNASTILNEPINPDASEKVYKINKRFKNINWTPALTPYSSNEIISASGGENYNLSLLNSQVDPFKIFDSNSGIVIDDFGVPEKVWNDSLFGILGFTYNQFNSSLTKENNLTKRITERSVNNLNFAITNADVNAGQAMAFNVNGWGVPLYNSQLPITYFWNGSGVLPTTEIDGARKGFLPQNYPPITETATSIKLEAINLPRKMLKPYYCIRSDILDQTHYLGGEDSGQALNCVAIVNKISGFGDFYFGEESPYIFTCTQRKVLTSITTSIHSPDQKYANVNNDSCVIYKIIKNIPAQIDVLDQILQDTSPKDK